MNTLETLQALRQEILNDCIVHDNDLLDTDFRNEYQNENDAVLVCVEVIDEYIEREKQNQKPQ